MSRRDALAVALLPLAFCSTARAQDRSVTRLILRIEGMYCRRCSRRIENVLEHLDGVASADVDFDQSRAVVSYEPRRVSPSRIIQAIEDAGFQARIEE